MAKYKTTATFDRRAKRLDPTQKDEFREACVALSDEIDANGFNFRSGGPLDLHTYTGFVSPPTVWSMDWGKGNDHRAIFTVEDDLIVWHFVGTHADIKRWQHEIGGKGLQVPPR